MKEVKLASGATLKIGDAPFPEAKALFQAFLVEARSIPLVKWDEQVNVMKDIFCAAFASEKLEAALWVVMGRSQYNGLSITAAVFEPKKAREDFVEVCYLVAQENLQPFTKSLYAKFKEIFKLVESIQA